MTYLAVSTEYRRMTDRQTDGRIDGRTDILPQHNPRYAYASRGNKTAINCWSYQTDGKQREASLRQLSYLSGKKHGNKFDWTPYLAGYRQSKVEDSMTLARTDVCTANNWTPIALTEWSTMYGSSVCCQGAALHYRPIGLLEYWTTSAICNAAP